MRQPEIGLIIRSKKCPVCGKVKEVGRRVGRDHSRLVKNLFALCGQQETP